ncbi:hypothetical protein ACYSNX_01405 [Myroides sp. LJL115]
MKHLNMNKTRIFLLLSFFLLSCFLINAQQVQNHLQNYEYNKKWKFGGGLGLGFGSGYTDIMLAPSAIREFSPYFSAGVSLQANYIHSKNRSHYYDYVKEYNSWLYGGSLIVLSNPLPYLQLSLELEQLRANNTYTYKDLEKVKDNFWNTGLFAGIGYTSGPVTIGVRYNVLYKEKDMIYPSAYMPFIRLYF